MTGSATTNRRYSLVGLSAAEYAASHDIDERGSLFSALLKLEPSLAVDLAVQNDWWAALESAFNDLTLDTDLAYLLAQTLRERGPSYPKIFAAIVDAIPERVAFQIGIGTYDRSLPEVWKLLEPRFARLRYDEAVGLLNILLKKSVIAGTDAVALYDLLPLPEPGPDLADNSHSFYTMLPSLLGGLSSREARRFFERTVNLSAIQHCSSAYDSGRATTLGASNIYECARIVTKGLSLSGGIAWANRVLVKAGAAYVTEYGLSYTGGDISGPGHSTIGSVHAYQDNGWLLHVTIPLLEQHLCGVSLKTHRQLLNSVSLHATPLHPSFRARALVLATPKERLADLVEELIRLCDFESSVPALSDAVARRALSSDPLAVAYVKWAWERRRMLVQPDEARALHQLLRSPQHSTFARDIARKVVTAPTFASFEDHRLGFFDQLDWADRDPAFALELVLSAIRAGYRPHLLDISNIVRILKVILTNQSLASKVLGESDLTPYLPYAFDADIAEAQPDLQRLFTNADKHGKIDLLHKAQEWALPAALPLIKLGLHDPDPILESDIEREFQSKSTASIAGVRVNAYWTMLLQLQTGGIEAYRALDFDLLASIQGEKGAYAAHHALKVLHVLLNCAATAEDYPLGLRVIEVAVGLLALRHQQIDEDVAYFIVWWWSKLPERFHDLARKKLHYTESYFGRLVARTVLSHDADTARELATFLPGASRGLASWVAWYLWRLLEEGPERSVSLDQPEVQAIVDMLLGHPESDRFATVARLLVEHQVEAQNFATSRLLQMARLAIQFQLPLFFADEHPVSLGDNADALVTLLEELGNYDLSRSPQLVEFALGLLQDVDDHRLTGRIQAALDRLPKGALINRHREQWRRKISR